MFDAPAQWGKGFHPFCHLLFVGLLAVFALEDRVTAARFALTDEYVIDNWQTEDGLPENSTTAAASDMERSQALAELTRGNAEFAERVRARTDELQRLVNLMAGREVRMAELKTEIRRLKGQAATGEPHETP